MDVPPHGLSTYCVSGWTNPSSLDRVCGEYRGPSGASGLHPQPIPTLYKDKSDLQPLGEGHGEIPHILPTVLAEAQPWSQISALPLPQTLAISSEIWASEMSF